MFYLRVVFIVLISIFCYVCSLPATSRGLFSFLNFGYGTSICNGCPQRYCDDDPAIITGYCCGCASIFDVLPITCYGSIQCPLDKSGLCYDYNYMRHCCC